MSWQELAPYARRAPSPHNTQPVRLRVVDDTRAELVLDTARGLDVGDPRGRFTLASCGIFVESLRIAAHARGQELETTYRRPSLHGSDEAQLRTVADLRLSPRGHPIEDLDPALLLRRRTNRHPYDRRGVPAHVARQLRDEARRHGHRFELTTDGRAVRWVKELNYEALYHDLERPAYRRELASWLRYSEVQARQRQDGLSPGTLVLPGWVMRGMMQHHTLFTAPVLRPLMRSIYLRTMSGISTVGWVQGDFAEPDDWVRAGALMLRLWLILTRHGVEWQPYGSVITNDASRAAMVERLGMTEGADGHDMVWLLVRIGYANREPVRSARLPIEELVR